MATNSGHGKRGSLFSLLLLFVLLVITPTIKAAEVSSTHKTAPSVANASVIPDGKARTSALDSGMMVLLGSGLVAFGSLLRRKLNSRL